MLDAAQLKALKAQFVAPKTGMPHDIMVSKLGADPAYRRMFDQAFPGQGVSVDTVGKALAVFQRSLVFTSSSFDRWVAGDETAIPEDAKRGFVQFNTRGGLRSVPCGLEFHR